MKNIFRNMPMSTHILLVATIAGSNVCAQGSFRNLGFENPILPLVPDANGFVPASNAIPGWTPSTLVLYNNISLGAPSVDLFGPNQSVSIIEGSYSVVLQAGFNGTDHVAASIE